MFFPYAKEIADSFLVQVCHLSQIRHHKFPERAAWHLSQQRPRALDERCTTVGSAQVDTLAELAQQKPRQGLGVLQAGFEGLGPLGTNQGVGILAFGKKKKPRFPTVSHDRQGLLQSAAGGVAPGAVAIEAEHDAWHAAKDDIQMLPGRRSAESGDRRHVFNR